MFCRPNYDHELFFNAFTKQPRDLAKEPRCPLRGRDKAVLRELAAALVDDRALLRTGCGHESARRNTGNMTNIELFDVLWALKSLLPPPALRLPPISDCYEGIDSPPSSSTCGCTCGRKGQLPDSVVGRGKERANESTASLAPRPPQPGPSRGRKSKDEVLARHHELPLSATAIVKMPLNKFLSLLKSDSLTPKQKDLIRLIRKRGKNKEAARSCRARRAMRREEGSREWGEEEDEEERGDEDADYL